MDQDRKSEVRRGLFRGAGLHLDNAEYLLAVRAFTGELSSSDLGSGNLTSEPWASTAISAAGAYWPRGVEWQRGWRSFRGC